MGPVVAVEVNGRIVVQNESKRTRIEHSDFFGIVGPFVRVKSR